MWYSCTSTLTQILNRRPNYFHDEALGDQCAWGEQAPQGMCFSKEELISLSSDYSYSLMDYWL